jgi:bidirectional [NiFe] hydrogenase diaphorase subunit
LLAALRAAAAAGGTAAGASAAPEPLEVRSVGCLRLCGEGPLLAWDGPEGTRLFGGLAPAAAAALVDQVRGVASLPLAADPALAGHQLDL